MSLSDEERALIVSMQLEKSARFMTEAETVAGLGLWNVVANRIYYSVFHAVAAMLIHDGIEVRSHKGAGLMFGQKYVMSGLFPPMDGRLYAKLQDLREKSDYNLVYQSDEQEMKPLIDKSKELIERIRVYIAG